MSIDCSMIVGIIKVSLILAYNWESKFNYMGDNLVVGL